MLLGTLHNAKRELYWVNFIRKEWLSMLVCIKKSRKLLTKSKQNCRKYIFRKQKEDTSKHLVKIQYQEIQATINTKTTSFLNVSSMSWFFKPALMEFLGDIDFGKIALSKKLKLIETSHLIGTSNKLTTLYRM